MRTIAKCVLLTAAAVGCAGSGTPLTGSMAGTVAAQQSGGSQQVAAAPAYSAGQPAAYASNGAPITPPTWSERLLAALPANPFAKSPEEVRRDMAAQQAALERKYDPLALHNAVGTPAPAVYISMAQMSEHGGNLAHARDFYAKALASDSHRLDALLGLARLEDREGNLDAALEFYHQAAAIEPQSPTALNDLALCYARKGELPRSLALLDRATQLAPRNPLYRNNIAKVLVKLNLLNDAVAHQMGVYPPAIAQYNVGVLLSEQYRQEEATAFLHAALAIDPSLEPARDLLAQLGEDQEQGSVQISGGGASFVRQPQEVASRAVDSGAGFDNSYPSTPLQLNDEADSSPAAMGSQNPVAPGTSSEILPTPQTPYPITSSENGLMLLPAVP